MADISSIAGQLRELIPSTSVGSATYFINGFGLDVAEDGGIIILNKEGEEIGFAWRDTDGRFHLRDLEGREWIYSQEGTPLGCEDPIAARSVNVREEERYAENICDLHLQTCPDENEQLWRSTAPFAETAPKIIEPKESRVSKVTAKKSVEPREKIETKSSPAIYVIPEEDPKSAAEVRQFVVAEQPLAAPLAPLTPQPLQIAAVPEQSATLVFMSSHKLPAGHEGPITGHGKNIASDNQGSVEITRGAVLCFNPAVPQNGVSEPPSIHEEIFNPVLPQSAQGASARMEPNRQLPNPPTKGFVTENTVRHSRSNSNESRRRASRGELAESSPDVRPRSKNNGRENTLALNNGEAVATANFVGAPASPSHETRDAGAASVAAVEQKRANRQALPVDGRHRDHADDRGRQGRDQDENPEEQNETV